MLLFGDAERATTTNEPLYRGSTRNSPFVEEKRFIRTLVDKDICLINLSDIQDKPPRLREPRMSMYFYDDTDDWPEYKIVKDEIKRLEVARLEFREKLQKAESALMSDPANKDAKVKVDELKKQLKETEKRLTESLSMYR
jgi:hypothetical protein